MSGERDFNTISPSAGALLMMKALTGYPFCQGYCRNGRRPGSFLQIGPGKSFQGFIGPHHPL